MSHALRLGINRRTLLLARAVSATFANRGTSVDVAPIAFTPDFTEQPSTLAQWTAFRTRLSNAQCPEKLSQVVTVLAGFLLRLRNEH